jgi:protease-4
MSDANREQITGLLNSVWTSVTAEISKSRNVSVEKLNEIANGLLAHSRDG